MVCPYCSHNDTKVTDKRDDDEKNTTRRRRECLACGKRFSTYERVERLEISVVKKDGRREKYDRMKIEGGIARACEKRPVCLSNLENIADQVEAELRLYDNKEVPSRFIGELVMQKLKNIDEVGYMRFASVYRSFSDIDSFEDELEQLKLEKQ